MGKSGVDLVSIQHMKYRTRRRFDTSNVDIHGTSIFWTPPVFRTFHMADAQKAQPFGCWSKLTVEMSSSRPATRIISFSIVETSLHDYSDTTADMQDLDNSGFVVRALEAWGLACIRATRLELHRVHPERELSGR